MQRRLTGSDAPAAQIHHRTLVEQIPAIIVVFELHDGGRRAQPIYVSPQTGVILGVPAETWLEDYDSILARIHPDDGPTVIDAFRRRRDDGHRARIEVRATRADGEEIWLGDAGAVLTMDSGVDCVQTMLFDITDAKRAEAERESMEQELRLGQKLEAVGQLAAGMAHEINTPTQFVGDTDALSARGVRRRDGHARTRASRARDRRAGRDGDPGGARARARGRGCGGPRVPERARPRRLRAR